MTDLTWDEVWGSIGAEVWKLAPEEEQASGNRDINFLTNWQDIMAAVDRGILAVAAIDEREVQDGRSEESGDAPG